MKETENENFIIEEYEGSKCKFYLIKDTEIKHTFEELNLRMFLKEELVFDTSLPIAVRNEMKEHCFSYAFVVDFSEPILFFYTEKQGSYRVSLKYLKVFSSENINIEINNITYTYFMTNSTFLLKSKLKTIGCRLPKQKEWRINPALHKNVMDKMEKLGAVYSVTTSHGCSILNYHIKDKIPFIIDLEDIKEIPLMKAALGAAINSDDVIMLQLVCKTKDDADRTIQDSWKPLHLCATGNSINCAKKLLELGADINATADDGITPLMIAALKGNKEIIQLFLENGANTHAKSNINWTAYMCALACNHEDIAEMLLYPDEQHKKFENLVSSKGSTTSFHDKLTFFISRFIMEKHTPCEIYKNLNGCMSKQTFSKLQTCVSRPEKRNVILLAIGLRLSLEDTESLLESAYYSFYQNDKTDKVIRNCIKQGIYDTFSINDALLSETGETLEIKKRRRKSCKK